MAAEDSYIHLYIEATKLYKSGSPNAIETMKQSFTEAIAAGDENYAESAAINGTEWLYQENKVAAAGAYANECHWAIEAMPRLTLPAARQQKRRIVLLGYRERGLHSEGKIGAAWKTNRQVAELLRGNQVTAHSDGPSITVAEVAQLPGTLADSGWRLLEREAEYLDLAGRTNEAKAMLDEAATTIKRQWPAWSDQQRFYPSKALATRADLLDFLGYQTEAIAAQEELARMIIHCPTFIYSYATLKMNLLRNKSQWFGPSEELLDEARAISAQAIGKSTKIGMQSMVAKMELDLRESKEALAALAKISDEADSDGSAYDAFYGKRDHLQARLNAGEKNLDAEFQSMLLELRRQGNKRGEPTIYRNYGRFLLEDGRSFDALQMYREALRLTRSFGWTFHEAPLLASIIQCHFEMKDQAGLIAAMAALEKFLIDHPELPLDRRFSALTSLALFWSELGEVKKMQAAWDQATEASKSIPEYQTRWVTPALKQKILHAKSRFVGKELEAIPTVDVQPTSLTSLGHGSDPICAHFSLANAGERTIQGHWIITGAAASASHQGKTWSSEGNSLRIPDRIAAGQVSTIVPQVSANASAGATVQVAWENENQPAGRASLWELRWGQTAASQVILDASFLTSNPFRSLSLFHEVAILPQSGAFEACRIKSSVPLRLEYYENSSQKLLAVDANGNGDFSEEGDMHLVNKAGQAAAMLPLPAGLKQTSLEVKLFSIDGKAPNPSGEEITLTTEILRSKTWITESVNKLK